MKAAELIAELRSRVTREEGFTLIEMLVAMSLLTVVMVIFLSALLGAQSTVSRASARSASNDQARLAVEELDREIRSGNVLYDPANCPPPPANPTGPPTCDVTNGIDAGMSLLVYTQTNANSRNPGNQCVQWRITPADSSGQSLLQRRDWSVNWQTDGIVEGWRNIAQDIVNRQPPPSGGPVAAFTLDPNVAYGGRVVAITLLTNGDPANPESQTVTTTTEVTGRNTEYGYPSNICSAIPPY